MARVFVSHASADFRLAGELHGWLIADGHEVFLDQDLRDGIAMGEEWQQRLHERLRWADAVVCVLTSAYRDSTWCAAEVGIAQAHGSRLLPLLAESGAEHPLLPPGRYQFALLVHDPVAARAALGEALRRVDAAGGLGWAQDRSPFPGLRPFEPDLHRVFFGRHAEVAALADLLRSPATAADAAMVLVVGPSGCGKSSLVRGGLLPMMAGEPGWETLPAMVPGADPIGGLARAVAVAAQRLDLGWTVRKVREQLGHSDGLAVLADELVVAGGGRTRQLLVVDQFEELLTLTAPAAGEWFAGLLKTALATPLQVVATLRADFLGPLLADGNWAALPARSFMLRPLARAALPAVIEGPARLAGIGVDDDLVSRLVTDTDTGDALPLLAFTLAQLAEDVGRGGHLSAARYDQLGGVQGALIGQADAALADALAAGGRTREQVIAGLLRLVTVDEQGRPIRSRADRDELPAPVRAELDSFVARRLLTTDTDDDGRVVLGVAHEAFLSAWPPLAAAISAAASALRTRRVVELAAADWDDAGRPPDQLWERGQLAAAVTGVGARLTTTTEHPPEQTPVGIPPQHRRPAALLPGTKRALVTDKVDLSSRARDFLRLSIRRDRRRRGRTVTVLSVLLALAVALAGVAFLLQRVAQDREHLLQEQYRIVTGQSLASQAETVIDDDPRTALLLGIAAQDIHDDPATRSSLVSSLVTTPLAGSLTGHNDTVRELAFTPDGRTLASGSRDNTVLLWDMANNTHGEPLTGHTDWVSSVAFAPDGRTLATGSDDKTVILWDVRDRSRPVRVGQLKGHTEAVESVAFAPDGRTVATGSDDTTVMLWDVEDRAQPVPLGQSLTGHTAEVYSVAFSPDGRTLASGSRDSTVILWDVTDPSKPTRLAPPLEGHQEAVNSVAFSPNGHTLATASRDRTVILWNLTDRDNPTALGKPQTGHRDEVFSVAFSPDGTKLATGSEDHEVRLWNLTARDGVASTGQLLLGHLGAVFTVAFSPTSLILATGGDEETVILWDFGERPPAPLGSPLTGHDDGVNWVAFGRDDHTLATGSSDRSVRLWDLTDRHHAAPGASLLHEESVESGAFSPDAAILATGSDDGAMRLWRLTDPAHAVSLGPPVETGQEAVASVAFSPDGQLLVTGGDDGTIRLWKVTDRANPTALGPPREGHEEVVGSVAFSWDGQLLATGSEDETIGLWNIADTDNPALIAESEGDGGPVESVAFSRDGQTLVSSNDDSTVVVWDVTNPADPTPIGPPLRGHNNPVTSVAFSPDGSMLATASDDATVQLWDFSDRAQPAKIGPPLMAHQEAVTSVAFSPDGRTLASVSDDKTLQLWDFDELNAIRDDSLARACAITGRSFNRDEWDRHASPLPYQDTCGG